MTVHRTRVLAWSVFAVVVVLAAGGVAIVVTHPKPGALSDEFSSVFYTLDPVGLAAVAVVILSTLHRSRIGWLMLGAGFSQSFVATVQTYTDAAYAGGGLPADHWVAWATDTFWPLPFCTLFFLLLLFPGGQLPSRRWRPVAWLAGAVPALFVLGGLVQSGSLANYERWRSPVPHVPLLSDLAPHETDLFPLLGIALVACGAALVVRLLRSRGQERAQLRWVLWAAALTLVTTHLGWIPGLGPLGDATGNIAVLLIPVAIGVAISRHNLYEIDRIISRTVSYAVLTGLLVGVYIGVVTLATRFLPINDSLGVAASTLAVAALFQPLRRRVQGGVDRRFNRSRYDAQSTIDAFGTRLRQQVDLDALSSDLIAVVRTTMQPAQVSLWLREPGRSPEVAGGVRAG